MREVRPRESDLRSFGKRAFHPQTCGSRKTHIRVS